MDIHTPEVVIFVIITTIVLLLLVFLVVNLLLLGRNRRLKYQNQLLEVKTNYEKELLKTQVEVAENTLNDLARDLHDDIGQLLTFSIISLNSLPITNNAEFDEKIVSVKEVVQTTMNTIRYISRSYSSEYLSKFGFREAITRLFERINRSFNIHAEIDFPEAIVFNSHSNEIFLYRILQELINNSYKHSQGDYIKLTINEQNGNLHIEYHDNGIGLPVELLKINNLKNSLGFTNIFNRAEFMKGDVKFPDGKGKGFHFIFSFPND